MSAGENNVGCPECEKLRREVQALKRRVEELATALEAAQRAGKRQAAPFRKKEPKTKPKKPGRKSGEDHGLHAYPSPIVTFPTLFPVGFVNRKKALV